MDAPAPGAGEITLDGRQHRRLTPDLAHRCGIAVIYQNLSLIRSLSISGNIFLDRELRAGPFVRQGEQVRLAQAALDTLLGDDDGLNVRQIVEDLPMSLQCALPHVQ